MDFSKDAVLDPEAPKRIKIDDSRSEYADDDLQMSPADKLCEDELLLIFSNYWISTNDLLSFRLVSKSWRDAATTTLLRRDACVVRLCEDSNQVPPCFFKRSGKNTDENQLGQLTDLISSSQKFPANNFCIQTYNTFTRNTLLPDLLHFFKLHGDKIKTLRPNGYLSHKCLLDIFFSYAPILGHLDLSEAEIKSLNEGVDDEENTYNLEWTSKALPFKYLTLRGFEVCACHPAPAYYNDDNDFDNDMKETDDENCPNDCNASDYRLLHLLLSSPSKLGSIENVTLETLRIVLKEGKGHLIRSFRYRIHDAQFAHYASASQMTKLVSLNPKPKLSKVILDLESHYLATAPILTSLNKFIESFKDTVQQLEIYFEYNHLAWEPILKIPPMKNLRSFTLTLGTWRLYLDPRGFRLECYERNKEESKTWIDIRGTFFQFEDGISAQNYFPSLMEVSSDSSHSRFVGVSPMSLFSFKSNADTENDSSANWNCFPKVDSLKINRIDIGSRQRLRGTRQSLTETPLFAKVFPNIRILKFKCGKVSNFSSALWSLCPNVEFMEIYGISRYSSDRREVEMSHSVDKVFTGFSDPMLQHLRRSAAGLLCVADDSEEWKPKPAPTTPSISDLRRLKELKLNLVGKWSYKFASSVTGVHAFSKMPNTKFIISYDPETVLGLNNGRASYYSDEDSDDSADDYDYTNTWSDWGSDDGQNTIDGNIDGPNSSEENGDEQIAKYEELIFGAIKPYVQIVHQKQK